MPLETHLTPKDITTRLKFRADWFYDHVKDLKPYGLRKLNGRYRMPASGFERWMAEHDELAPVRGGDRAVENERRRLSAAS